MFSPLRSLDGPWLATLGLLTACGPQAPATDGTGSSSTGATTSDTPSTTGSTMGPTTGISTTDSTSGPVTGPSPGCIDDWDCNDGSCPYCSFGRCVDNCHPYDYCYRGECPDGYECDSYYGGCVPVPSPDCYTDDDCRAGEACGDGYCFLLPVPLPPCTPVQPAVSQWNMTQKPGCLGLADLDGDGDLDLYATLPEGAAIELAFNDGAGTFTPGEVVVVGPPQSELRAASGDLDGDGDLDLAVARTDSSDLLLLFGQDGMFTPGPILPASAPPRTIAAADLDLDGDTDLVTVGGALGSVSAWVGDGLGGFAPELLYPDLLDAPKASAQHLNADAIPDFLALKQTDPEWLSTHIGQPDVSWAYTMGAALFAPAWTYALAGDLGGLTYPELMLLRLDGLGGAVLVSRGFSDLQWDSPTTYLADSPLLGGVLADEDGDGNADLVSATGAPTVAVLVGDGQGGFWCEHVFDVPAATAPELLAAGELDGELGAEIVVGSPDSPTITVLGPP